MTGTAEAAATVITSKVESSTLVDIARMATHAETGVLDESPISGYLGAASIEGFVSPAAFMTEGMPDYLSHPFGISVAAQMRHNFYNKHKITGLPAGKRETVAHEVGEKAYNGFQGFIEIVDGKPQICGLFRIEDGEFGSGIFLRTLINTPDGSMWVEPEDKRFAALGISTRAVKPATVPRIKKDEVGGKKDVKVRPESAYQDLRLREVIFPNGERQKLLIVVEADELPQIEGEESLRSTYRQVFFMGPDIFNMRRLGFRGVERQKGHDLFCMEPGSFTTVNRPIGGEFGAGQMCVSEFKADTPEEFEAAFQTSLEDNNRVVQGFDDDVERRKKWRGAVAVLPLKDGKWGVVTHEAEWRTPIANDGKERSRRYYAAGGVFDRESNTVSDPEILATSESFPLSTLEAFIGREDLKEVFYPMHYEPLGNGKARLSGGLRDHEQCSIIIDDIFWGQYSDEYMERLVEKLALEQAIMAEPAMV